MTVFWTIVIAAVALFVWMCLFRIVPRNLMSMFRYRLWRQRDDLMLAIRAGEFENEEEPQKLVRLLECYIASAPEMTAFNVLLLHAARWRVDVPPVPEMIVEFSKLGPRDRERLEERDETVRTMVAVHVMLETPSGWALSALTMVVSPLILLIRAILRREKKISDDAKEFANEGASELISKGPRRRHELRHAY